MIKRSLKSAIGISIGLAIGGSILPRLFFAEFYNATFPPIWKHALLYFVVGYAVSFVVFLGINYIKALLDKRQ